MRTTLPAILLAASIVQPASADRFEMWGAQNTSTTHTLERFVPTQAPNSVPISTLELRPAATIVGNGDVTLRQVCRWADADSERFSGVQDLVVARLGSGFGTVDIEQIEQALADAGMPTASINFRGSLRCTVSRADIQVDEGAALQQWVSSGGSVPSQVVAATKVEQRPIEMKPLAMKQPAPIPVEVRPPAAEPIAAQVQASVETPVPAVPQGDLRATLIRDVAARTNLPVDRLQVDFAPEDRALLSLASPAVRFDIQPQRFGDLGETSWYITLEAAQGQTRKVRLRATARAWIDQVVAKRTINTKQAISGDDVEVRRVLTDKLVPEAFATADQAVGQQASREVRAGTILTGKMLAPLELVRSGQAITVAMRRGAIHIRSVATALQSGSMGDNVRVRNPTTNEVYQVQLTGPQTGVVATSDPVMANAAD